MRIASLLPSATEIVAALGLEESLVAVSHECDHPAGIRGLPVVTRSVIDSGVSSGAIDLQVREHLQTNTALYALDTDLLEQLRPDLILTQALCDVCAVSGADVERAVEELSGNPLVVNVEPFSLDDVLGTIEAVGMATATERVAAALVARSRARIEAVSSRVRQIGEEARPTVALLEWTDPLFCGGHWNPELIELAGGIDAFANRGNPGRRVTWSDLSSADPDFLLFACCGFSLDRSMVEVRALTKRGEWPRLRCVREGRVAVVNGNAYFSRPGPRLVESLEILAYALWPETFGLRQGLRKELAGAEQIVGLSSRAGAPRP